MSDASASGVRGLCDRGGRLARRRSGEREGARGPVAAAGAARRRRGPEAFSLLHHLCFIFSF